MKKLIIIAATIAAHYDFMDAEGEGDGYADYQAARDRIDSLTIK